MARQASSPIQPCEPTGHRAAAACLQLAASAAATARTQVPAMALPACRAFPSFQQRTLVRRAAPARPQPRPFPTVPFGRLPPPLDPPTSRRDDLSFGMDPAAPGVAFSALPALALCFRPAESMAPRAGAVPSSISASSRCRDRVTGAPEQTRSRMEAERIRPFVAIQHMCEIDYWKKHHQQHTPQLCEESEVHCWCCGAFAAVCADCLLLRFNPTSSSNVN